MLYDAVLQCLTYLGISNWGCLQAMNNWGGTTPDLICAFNSSIEGTEAFTPFRQTETQGEETGEFWTMEGVHQNQPFVKCFFFRQMIRTLKHIFRRRY